MIYVLMLVCCGYRKVGKMKKIVLMNNVYGYRKRKKLTQKGLADLIGTSRETISYIERGDFHTASIKLCLLISIALDCDINDLFWLEVVENG